MDDVPRRPSRLPPAGGVSAPRVPFDRWPVQVFDPAFGFVWYTRPATYVTQLVVPHGTLACARAIQDHIDLLLVHRAAEIAEHAGLLVIHDWRVATGYDADARREFIERLRARPRSYLRGSVTCVALSPMLRMVVQAGNLVATMVTGAKSEVASDPAPALRAHRVEAPPLGARFPGREVG